jgi:hypothetical protein
MKVEKIAKAVAELSRDQYARFRHCFTTFDAGLTDHAKELNRRTILTPRGGKLYPT